MRLRAWSAAPEGAGLARERPFAAAVVSVPPRFLCACAHGPLPPEGAGLARGRPFAAAVVSAPPRFLCACAHGPLPPRGLAWLGAALRCGRGLGAPPRFLCACAHGPLPPRGLAWLGSGPSLRPWSRPHASYALARMVRRPPRALALLGNGTSLRPWSRCPHASYALRAWSAGACILTAPKRLDAQSRDGPAGWLQPVR